MVTRDQLGGPPLVTVRDEFGDIAFSDSGREQTAQIAELCLLAGRAAWIPGLIRAGALLEDVRGVLAAEAPAGAPGVAQPSGSRPPAEDPCSGQGQALAAVAAARFEAQSRRYD